MSRILKAFSRLLGLVVLLATPLAARAAEPPPLAAYGNLPDIESMALSNSGQRIAAVMAIGGERVVLMMTSALETIRMMRLQDAKVRSLEWVGDDRLVVTMSRTETLPPEFLQSKIEFWHAFILPADPAKEQQMVFGDDPTILNAIFSTHGVRQVGGRWMAYFGGVEKERGGRGYYIGNTAPELFAVDVETNERRQVADQGSQGYGYDWLLGPDGRLAAMMSIEIRSGDWQIKVPDGPVIARGNSPKGEVNLVVLGKDGRSLIYSETGVEDRLTRWFEVPLDGSAQPSEFMRADQVDRTFTDRTNGQLLGFLRTGAGQRPQFYNPEHQRAVTRIYRAFANFDVDLMDWTPDFSRVLVRTTGNSDSGTWYLVDMAQMRAAAVGYERQAIGPEHVGAISRVEYKASDGLDVSGILTLPPGREARNLPVVLLPHGGPHSHDEAVFDWWAQAFASRGYAVFQPNFRGSTDRDEGFMRAGFGEWGRKMQTDISDGLAELARQGIVDLRRACIMGASYGGYAALAGVTLQQGLYRCAVAVAPVSDLERLYADELNDGGRSGMLRRNLNEEFGPRDGIDAVSPIRFANRADAPVLLIHGRDDTVVPFSHSDRMADALKDAGKPYKLVVLREEDHWLSRAATRRQMLEEAMAFVQQHNPPD